MQHLKFSKKLLRSIIVNPKQWDSVSLYVGFLLVNSYMVVQSGFDLLNAYVHFPYFEATPATLKNVIAFIFGLFFWNYLRQVFPSNLHKLKRDNTTRTWAIVESLVITALTLLPAVLFAGIYVMIIVG